MATVDFKSQGRCETTQTERFENPACRCLTYKGNLGPCKTYLKGVGAQGQCVYCDHRRLCHEGILAELPPEPREDVPNQPSREVILEIKNAALIRRVERLTEALKYYENKCYDSLYESDGHIQWVAEQALKEEPDSVG